MDDIEEFYVQLGERIREARRKSKLTQAELAELLNLNRTSIANIEGGRQRLHAHSLIRLYTLLDFKIPNTELELAFIVDDKKRKRLADEVRDLRSRLHRVRIAVDGRP